MTTTYDVEAPLDLLLAAAEGLWLSHPGRPWSVNERLHPLALHSLRTQWRGTFALLARSARNEGRLKPMERAVVLAWPRYSKRPLDPGNEAGAVKAALDGIVKDAGLLPSDTGAHVVALIHLAPEVGPDRLRLALVAC